MLIYMVKDIEKKAGVVPSHESPKFTAADEEVFEHFVARLRRQIAAENAADGADASAQPH